MLTQLIDLMGNLCQISESVEAARKNSFILFFLYALSYAKNKQSCFLVAFILIEFTGFSVVFDYLTEFQYHLLKSVIYASLFFTICANKFKVNILLSCGSMVLFQMIMALDAVYYEENYSLFFNNHTLIVAIIHLFIIYTLHEWRCIKLFMGSFVRAVSTVFGSRDAVAFFCYNLRNSQKNKTKS